MDESRKHDIKMVTEGIKSRDPLMRRVAMNAGNEIRKQNQDGWTRAARERLIKETQSGNSDNARQVREDMIRHRGGRQGKGNRGEVISASFNWSPGQYERIYGRHGFQN